MIFFDVAYVAYLALLVFAKWLLFDMTPEETLMEHKRRLEEGITRLDRKIADLETKLKELRSKDQVR